MNTPRYQTGIWALLMLLGLSFFVLPGVQAATPGVVDNAHILQADTVSKVSAALGELKQKYKKDILIETFASIPAEKKDTFKSEEKGAFFSSWAKTREAAEQVNGVYVLICMDPSYLQIEVGDKTQQHAFTLADRDQLKQKLVAGFKQKQYDEAIREVPVFVQNTFAANLKTMHNQPVERSGAAVPISNSSNSGASATPEAHGTSFGSILFVLFFILLGVMVFSFIARMLFGGGAGAGSPGYAGGGGGGFFSSLLGGIGGAIAGNYIYDSFFRGDSHSSGSSDVNAAGSDSSSSSPWGDNSTDSSFSGDGGGFDSGGSDFGGGDSGGGGDF